MEFLKPSKKSVYSLYCDGASRGNPGRASIGAVLFDAHQREVFAVSKKLGDNTTNNVAEYQSLICGLEEALQLGIGNLQVWMDSQLVVRQMTGLYRVKHPGLLPLFRKARELSGEFEQFSIEHVPREKNKRADALANQALDAKEQDGPQT